MVNITVARGDSVICPFAGSWVIGRVLAVAPAMVYFPAHSGYLVHVLIDGGVVVEIPESGLRPTLH